MAFDFKIQGRVVERESNRAIAGVRVRAYDKDLLFDDVLGDATTDGSGEFSITYSKKDFSELFETRPDLYFLVFDQGGERAIHSTADHVRWNADRIETVEIKVPQHKLPPVEDRNLEFLDSQGRPVKAVEAGDSLMVSVRNLKPNHSHRVRLLDDDEHEILSASLVANRFGVIAPTVLWPDVGIGIPEKGGRYAFETHEQAFESLKGKTFTVEVLDGDAVNQRGRIQIADNLKGPRLFPASERGALQRGLLLGQDELRIEGRNFPPGALVDLYLVKRKVGWRTGDAIDPVREADGSEVVKTVQLDAETTNFATVLWDRERMFPGSYDIVARVTQAGEYQRGERVLRETDFVSERLITTLVIRDDIFHYKPIKLGCVMAVHEIAGKMLWGVPEEILYTNNFPRGTDVWAALDPAGLMPTAFGKKVRYYVVAHKDAVQWGMDSGLTNVTGSVTEVITSPSCVNANAALVWSNPMVPGKYDLVVDFGNNNPDPAMYMTDGSFDPPLDMIDGYLNVGFYVTDDPSVAGTYAIGSTTFSDPAVTIPAVGVWGPPPLPIRGNTPSGTLSLPLTAEVRYPADMAGANVPVSATKPNYPVVVIMHGMHTTADPSYQGYNYLLNHLASHGFIAVSIDCNAINAIGGFQDTRGHAILEHLSLLNSKNTNPGLFQSKIDMTRIGIMGHSRGGDGVVQAEIFNQSLGLGWNIRAIVALAPTDFSAISPTPMVLSTSKFLCLYGSNDGDVWGGSTPATQYTGTGFRFYDRATVEKAMVFIYGATHNRFNTEWGTEIKVDVTSPKVISFSDHQNLLRGYMTAFMQAHLEGRSEQLAYFTGELKIPQVSSVEVHTQYRPPSFLELDNFESAPALNQNTLGGTVSFADLDGTPDENTLATLDNFTPHQTRGLRLRWNATTATYQSQIPVGQRNLTGWKNLSFRVTQKVGSASNPAGMTRDFRVRLSTAGSGPSRAVRAGYFGAIPPPYKPEYTSFYDVNEDPNTKSAMKTIRIPLYAWTIKCLSVPQVDLTNVESVTFEFDYVSTGELEIDDVAFTE